MAPRRIPRVFALVLLVALSASVGASWPVRHAQAAAISIRLGCYSDPEVVTITNNRSERIFISTIGPIYRPQSNQPFAVDRRLNAGAIITFHSGPNATRNVLTRQFIFNNSVGAAEGVKVVTNVGAFIFRCQPRVRLPNTGAGTTAGSG